MKYLYIGVMFVTFGAFAQKTGINTREPKVSLEIRDNLDPAIPNGLIIPKISGVELQSKDALYGGDQNGIMVAVVAPLASPNTGKTEAVTESGYFYYDALDFKWRKLDRYIDVAAEKIIAQLNRSAVQQLISTTGTAVSWNDISGTHAGEDIKLSGVNKTVIELAPGKSYKIMGMTGIGSQSSVSVLKTKFELAEPITGTAKIYFSMAGTVESTSLDVFKGAGTYPICYVYSGDQGLKLKMQATALNPNTYIAGGPMGQNEGTFVSIQEL
ncbi:hypothetical protein [Flavobacterium sp. JP2137]|uniref:hypothetical protein n=1 Tax=Flavobacterium sp. JP2137 TaxID=3414510 RepID=UPI003D2FE14E